jgi:Phage integrase family
VVAAANRLRWSDVSFDDCTLTIREGKAKRINVLPRLAEALKARLHARPALGAARVCSLETVTNRTRLKDFLRAGIAREETVTDEHGKPMMVGEGTRCRPKTRIVATDKDGRVIDLHALRTTLGTQLARAGITPQIAQRIMRHSDYKTTLAHCTVLGISDTAGAVEALPNIGTPDDARERATGTNDASSASSDDSDHQPYPRRLGHESRRFDATGRDELRTTGTDNASATPTKKTALTGRQTQSG